MKKIVFATGNPHKLEEIQLILSDYTLIGLAEIGCNEEIPETSPTIQGNALQKARYVVENYDVRNCFAEDTGLEVDALNGEPGVYSARYAGASKDATANMEKVLTQLEHQTNRAAQFRTVVALILEGEAYTFEGIIRGTIQNRKTGAGGFGYDPVFVPEGETRSFAEMSIAEKNKISHRAKAILQLKEFLSS